MHCCNPAVFPGGGLAGSPSGVPVDSEALPLDDRPRERPRAVVAEVVHPDVLDELVRALLGRQRRPLHSGERQLPSLEEQLLCRCRRGGGGGSGGGGGEGGELRLPLCLWFCGGGGGGGGGGRDCVRWRRCDVQVSDGPGGASQEALNLLPGKSADRHSINGHENGPPTDARLLRRRPGERRGDGPPGGGGLAELQADANKLPLQVLSLGRERAAEGAAEVLRRRRGKWRDMVRGQVPSKMTWIKSRGKE